MHSENPVRIPVPAPVHRAASAESKRFALRSTAAFIPADGDAALVATDGRMLAVVPFQFPNPTDPGVRGDDAGAVRLIPFEAMQAATKRGRTDSAVYMNGTAQVKGAKGSSEFPIEDFGSFPPCADVIPAEPQIRKGIPVSLNPELLARLAEALGSGSAVSLIVDPEGNRPMVVIPHSHLAPEDAVGLLMPMMKGIDAGTKDKASRRCANAVRIIRAAEARKGGAK